LTGKLKTEEEEKLSDQEEKTLKKFLKDNKPIDII
jgi:hypothetical protein